MTPLQQLGANIRFARERRNLTIQQASAATNVEERILVEYEDGSVPKVFDSEVQALAHGFGVPVERIMRGVDP